MSSRVTAVASAATLSARCITAVDVVDRFGRLRPSQGRDVLVGHEPVREDSSVREHAVARAEPPRPRRASQYS